MRKGWMIISHSRFILFRLKIFGEIPVVTTNIKTIGLINESNNANPNQLGLGYVYLIKWDVAPI